MVEIKISYMPKFEKNYSSTMRLCRTVIRDKILVPGLEFVGQLRLYKANNHSQLYKMNI